MAGSSTHQERHNVGRVPELDYFVRKLYSGALRWGAGLKYSKAGEAQPYPGRFSSPDHYLGQMQAHAALEFQAATQEALSQADSPQPDRGWHPFELGEGGSWVSCGGGLDFEEDLWTKHVVQVRQTDSFHIVKMAKREQEGEERGADLMVVLPTIPIEGMGLVDIRSLGYMGSHLLQYDSAQELKYCLSKRQMPRHSRELLETVVNPQHWHPSDSCGSFVPSSRNAPASLREGVVPVNEGQRQAVQGLQGGLNLIHGPPGTGKSTTIFHVIDARVQRGQQALVTCTRNQAVDAVVDKISKVEGSILVFGHDKRLGERAKRFTLEARTERDTRMALWLGHVEQLKRLLIGLKQKAAAALKVVDTVLSQVQGALPDQVKSLTKLRDELARAQARKAKAKLVQSMVNVILGRIIPSLRSRIQREILRTTHLFVCTIDSTPSLVNSLQELSVPLELDTAVVDEAGCVLESAIPMLLRLHPANLVLVGDHLQLQAYSDLKQPPGNHCRSLMERAVGEGVPAAMLTTQYRMHPAICSVVSQVFYGSRLLTAPEAAARRSVGRACLLINVNGQEAHHPMAGYSNREEAQQAVQTALMAVYKLQQKGIRRPSVFIITMYNRQRDLIGELLQSMAEGRRLTARSSCQVLSVDACQGSEADAVVVSTVRNPARSSPYLSQFFHDRRRINVALSRARHISILVGSRHTLLRGGRHNGAWQAVAKLYSSK